MVLLLLECWLLGAVPAGKYQTFPYYFLYSRIVRPLLRYLLFQKLYDCILAAAVRLATCQELSGNSHFVKSSSEMVHLSVLMSSCDQALSSVCI